MPVRPTLLFAVENGDGKFAVKVDDNQPKPTAK